IYFADQQIAVEETTCQPEDGYRGYSVTSAAGRSDYRMDLMGDYQKKNLAGILVAIEVLRDRVPGLSEEAVVRGLSRIVRNTGLNGRWQKMGDKPLVFCDTGHNAEGIKMIVAQLKSIPHDCLFLVLGMSNDKDLAPVLSLLPQEARYVFCEAKLPRAISAEALQAQAAAHGLEGRVVKDVNEALAQVLKEAGEHDLVFVGGSTFVVAE